MSSAMVKAHGGSKIITGKQGSIQPGGIIHDTMAGSQKDVHMKSLDRLISQTTGSPKQKPVMAGVLIKTTPMEKEVPEIHKVAKGEVGKTKTKRMGQVAYSGPKY